MKMFALLGVNCVKIRYKKVIYLGLLKPFLGNPMCTYMKKMF